jgi:hypothetical protein
LTTTERLTAKHDAFVQVSLAGMAAQFNLFGNPRMIGFEGETN